MDTRPVERRSVSPYGGALEVASLDLVVHVRRRWSRRRCACGEPHPGEQRRQAEAALGSPRRGKSATLLILPVVVGMLLIAAAAVGLVR